MSAFGNLGNGNRDNLAGGRNAVSTSGGGFGSLTAWKGIGASMVADLDRVVVTAKRQYADDRKAAARERAAEREAAAFAALDDLLSEV
jgi:hypothetical protein